MFLPNPGQPGFVDFEIIVKRITLTTSLITVSWSVSGVKAIGPQCFYTGSSSTTGSIDFNVGSFIDFSVVSTQTIASGGIAVSATTLTVEKINQ
jgi:hypothetical protein